MFRGNGFENGFGPVCPAVTSDLDILAMTRRRKFLRERAREALEEAQREASELPKPPKLSEEVGALARRFAEGPLTMGDMVAALQGRAWTLVIMLLALPFSTPIPLPLISTPFGLAIALIALRLALGQKPWLPEKMLAKPLPPGFFGRVLRISERVLRVVEKLLKPRVVWLTEWRELVRLHALLIFVAACVLLLPMPVPFSNGFPAVAILLIAGGLLERDGLAIIAGYLVAAAGGVFFWFLGEGAVRLLELVKAWLFGG